VNEVFPSFKYDLSIAFTGTTEKQHDNSRDAGKQTAVKTPSLKHEVRTCVADIIRKRRLRRSVSGMQRRIMYKAPFPWHLMTAKLFVTTPSVDVDCHHNFHVAKISSDLLLNFME
jgi:hypothetical protein